MEASGLGSGCGRDLIPPVRPAKNMLNWSESRISTGLLEGYNSALQATKRKARGYRTIKNLIAMSYLIHGNLEVDNP